MAVSTEAASPTNAKSADSRPARPSPWASRPRNAGPRKSRCGSTMSSSSSLVETGGVGAASSAAAVTVTNKNTVTTLTTVTPAAGALVTAPPAAPALATGGAKAGLPAVNAGLNATTTGNVLGVGKQGTATGAPVKAPTAPPGVCRLRRGRHTSPTASEVWRGALLCCSWLVRLGLWSWHKG
ncbi:hypothetical protein PG984_012452 [Apiospora sp. TS-2023a]